MEVLHGRDHAGVGVVLQCSGGCHASLQLFYIETHFLSWFLRTR